MFLTEKTKEELIEEIFRLRKENEKLRKILESKEKVEARKKELKFARVSQRTLNPKTPGQKQGHKGITRRKPAQIDRVIEQTLACCPDCHGELSQSQEVIEHIQEDIIPARVEITCFKKHRYYCKHCGKMVMAPYAAEEVPHGFVGPNVLVHAVILKYHHGLPFNKIRELFEGLCQLRLTEGALAQALQRMSEWLQVEVKDILKSVRESPHIHMDETGWKVNGTNHWLWAAVNSRLAYYKIDRSRGSKVAKGILTDDYGGILISDFYSAYNRLGMRQQKCMVHLLREMKRCSEKDDSREYVRYHKILKQIIEEAVCLKKKRERISFRTYLKKVSQIRKRLLAWALRSYRNKNLERLANRFVKHATELLTFLEERDVSSNNNLAERMIRHHVILRNRSFQNRSEKGVKAHQTLMSILHTLQLQKVNAIETIKTTFLARRQGNNTPIISAHLSPLR